MLTLPDQRPACSRWPLPTVVAVEADSSPLRSGRPMPSVPMGGVSAANVRSMRSRAGQPRSRAGWSTPLTSASASAVRRQVCIGSTRS
jgi:hypothetical protein